MWYAVEVGRGVTRVLAYVTQMNSGVGTDTKRIEIGVPCFCGCGQAIHGSHYLFSFFDCDGRGTA